MRAFRLWITWVIYHRPTRGGWAQAITRGQHFVESNERYFRRRAAQELAAARRAVTPSAMLRRRNLAESYLRQLSELTGFGDTPLFENVLELQD